MRPKQLLATILDFKSSTNERTGDKVYSIFISTSQQPNITVCSSDQIERPKGFCVAKYSGAQVKAAETNAPNFVTGYVMKVGGVAANRRARSSTGELILNRRRWRRSRGLAS